MNVTKALLVGVSQYDDPNYEDLPLCKNDIAAMQKALVDGLNLKLTDIHICGETGRVVQSELRVALKGIVDSVGAEDNFIFYFSGHGDNSRFALSENWMETDQLINMIDFIPSKSKIIIMDCCHSGSIDLKKKYATFIPSSIDQFVGHGYAVMASCAADQTSGFRSDRQMSLYTSFV